MPKYNCNHCGDEINARERPNQCELCKSWNTFEVSLESVDSEGIPFESKPVQLSEVEAVAEPRQPSNILPVDTVLGGGFVDGSISLLSGEPGIGKSTLTAQICEALGKVKIMYVSGEESLTQIKLRTDRLGIRGKNVLLYNETLVENVFEHCTKRKIKFLVIDSVQTIRTASCASAMGSPNQVREAGNQLMAYAKTREVTTLLIGHVTKDGAIAGPKTLEHMVDTVLYFEQDSDNQKVRILRSTKNRFGDTSLRGIFEMGPTGLIPWKSQHRDGK